MTRCLQCDYLSFVLDYVYDALGPSADEVMDMADEAYGEKYND